MDAKSRRSVHTLPTNHHDSELRSLGFECIAGMDEVGRGALAGPVVAAAVILPADCEIEGVKDSKLLPAVERTRLYDIILDRAIAWGIGSVSEQVIDGINILQATFLAMHQAIAALSIRPDYLIVDGRDTVEFGIPCRAVIGGDALCISVAAASIIAKVTRDRILCQQHEIMPHYGFAQHKGYATLAHRAAILEYGPTSFHRQTFLTRILNSQLGLMGEEGGGKE